MEVVLRKDMTCAPGDTGDPMEKLQIAFFFHYRFYDSQTKK